MQQALGRMAQFIDDVRQKAGSVGVVSGMANWLCVIVILTAAGAAAQNPGQSDWNSLEKLRQGDRIEVFIQDGKSRGGRFETFSNARIDLAVGRKSEIWQAPREDVRRVVIVGEKSRLKGALYGALVGFGLGFTIGAAKAGYLGDTNNPRLGFRIGIGSMLGLFTAGFGGGVGAALGVQPRTVLYRAP